MSGRQIVGEIRWVRQGPKGGPFGVKHRARGSNPAAKAGLAYERSLGKALGKSWIHGMWLEWEDSAGVHWCQPDFVRLGLEASQSSILVLEAKLRWTPLGHWQLKKLYQPLLERLFARESQGVLVCKHLVPEAPKAYWALNEALTAPVPIVQWLGGKYFPLG